VSDPGYRLVRDARAEGLPVVPVPGPSAAVAALSVSGLPTDRFLFVGFLPARAAARRRELGALAARTETLVVYESPHRLLEALADLRDVLGEREAFLCREATKTYEEYRRGTLGALHALLAERGEVKGEVVLVVAGAPAEAPPAEVDDATLRAMFARLGGEGLTRRAAVKEIARRTGLPAREVYARVLDAGEEEDAG